MMSNIGTQGSARRALWGDRDELLVAEAEQPRPARPVLADQHATTAVGFLRRAVRWFAQRGVRVERVMTDNGSAYRAHRFHHACRLHGVRQIYTRFYRPQTNGKAERFIQTLLREWAYGVSYPSSWRRTRALRPWLRYYNGQRPHASLNYQPPASRFQRALQ